jgi:hypothetical protein
MSDNPLAALAMRERAADACKNHHDILWSWPEQSACDECEEAIRALPTTFTDAELLAAAWKLPEVRAMLEAVREQSEYLSSCGEDGDLLRNTLAALAPFKGDNK